MGQLGRSSEDIGNLRKTSDQLRISSDVSGRLRAYFGKIRVFVSGEHNLGLIVLLSSNQNPVLYFTWSGAKKRKICATLPQILKVRKNVLRVQKIGAN